MDFGMESAAVEHAVLLLLPLPQQFHLSLLLLPNQSLSQRQLALYQTTTNRSVCLRPIHVQVALVH